MTDILFIFAKLTPEVGYRQGMHELLAPILWTVDYDSLAPESPLDSLPHLVLSSSYIEHDAWSLFAALMKAASAFYDFTPSVPLPVDRSSASTTSLTLHHHAPLGSPSANTSTVLVQPIVGTAIRIHDGLLKTVDIALWAKMERLKVEPQLYAIRWLRLLFGREFPILDTLTLWDGLFAADPSLRLMEDICMAMLLRIRDALLDSDYSGFLQLLLRYPAPSDGNHRIDLLLSQAIFIRDNVSADAGERCRAQNGEERATAGVASGGHADTDQRRRGGGVGHGKTMSASAGPGGMAGAAAAALLAEGGGIVGDIAKGVYGRAEALGINKALFGTFNEIRVRCFSSREGAMLIRVDDRSEASMRRISRLATDCRRSLLVRRGMSSFQGITSPSWRSSARRTLRWARRSISASGCSSDNGRRRGQRRRERAARDWRRG